MDRLEPRDRAEIVRNALGIGVATGAYALSFGAISTAAGLSVFQTCALSLLMFTGASQYALVGVVGVGGSPWAGAATALLLGSRNGLYGVRLSSLLRARGARRAVAAQLVIDESTAMAVGQDAEEAARLAFWATGLSVFVLWNLGTLVGALAERALSNPNPFGLDAAAPAVGLAAAAAAVRLRAPFLVVVGLAAVVTALVRLAGAD